MSTMLGSDYISGVVTTADLSPSPSTADLLEFETLLSDISAQLIAATADRIGETIESALEGVRHFFRVDRCGILAVSDTKDSWNLTYAASPNVPTLRLARNTRLYFRRSCSDSRFRSAPSASRKYCRRAHLPSG